METLWWQIEKLTVYCSKWDCVRDIRRTTRTSTSNILSAEQLSWCSLAKNPISNLLFSTSINESRVFQTKKPNLFLSSCDHWISRFRISFGLNMFTLLFVRPDFLALLALWTPCWNGVYFFSASIGNNFVKRF